MEVATFLKAALRWWWIAVLVAALAAAGAYLVTRNTKDSYDASIVVTVPAAQAGTTGSNGQYVENFQTSLTTSDVVKQVARDTGESESALTDGLGASQLNNSSFIEVSYNSTSAKTAEAVVLSAAKRTGAYLSRSAVQSATTVQQATAAASAAADAALAKAQKALDTFAAAHGAIDPNVAYQAAVSAITQLTVSKQQAIAQGRSTTNFDAAIQQATQQAATLRPIVVEYNTLTERVRQAQLVAAAAQAREAASIETLVSAKEPPLLGSASRDLVTADSTIVKAVAIAGGVGLVLGIALVLLLTALTGGPRRGRGTRRTRKREPAADAQSTDVAAQPGAVTDLPERSDDLQHV